MGGSIRRTFAVARDRMTAYRYPDTTGWLEWQQEYRFGALFIFPPPGLIEPIDELRHRYDPGSARSCQAHISLSEPLRGPLTREQILELNAVLATVEPFDIRYGPLRVYSPYPGVAYVIEPEDRFMQLRRAVHSTSNFRTGPFERQHVPPHMTIAEFITLERSFELQRELDGSVPEGSFRCDAIEYAIPTDRLHFERVLVLPLGA